MNSTSPEPALWPLEIARLQAALRTAGDESGRDSLRGALWRLLFQSLLYYLRVQGRASRTADPADLEDIASEKALEILLRAESGAWDSAGRSGAEIRGYVATAARNGWVDLVQRSLRERRIPEGNVLAPSTTDPPEHARVIPEDPVARAEARELALAVRDCTERLPARERRVWFFRAYYEMSSRDIASHPGVRLKASHVDVLVRRARLALRECLRRRGHMTDDAPRSAFVELWNLLETLAEREPLEEPFPENGT